MRQRIQARLRKAIGRRPELARLLARADLRRLPVHSALYRVVNDTAVAAGLRGDGANLLFEVGRDRSVFSPLLLEFLACGDEKLGELCDVVRSTPEHHARAEFEILRSAIRNGTPERQFLLVDKVAFLYAKEVGPILISVLDDPSYSANVRAWAAERLSRHISRPVINACLRALEDPDPEVRLWSVCTLGCAAQRFSWFREAAIPVLERRLADKAEVPGWWPVHREAQQWLASLRGWDEVDRLQLEIEAILKDPTANEGDKYWAHVNSSE